MGLLNIPLKAYKETSQVTRQWAKQKGLDPIKATKALSETTRSMLDDSVFREMDGYTKPTSNVIAGLAGLRSRLGTGDRSRRTTQYSDPFSAWSDSNFFEPAFETMTKKGAAVDTFGRYLGKELRGSQVDKVRPKPETVFSGKKNTLAKKRLKGGSKGGSR